MRAHNTSEILQCPVRTVTFYLSNAMRTLKGGNKLVAVQRACWFGLI